MLTVKVIFRTSKDHLFAQLKTKEAKNANANEAKKCMKKNLKTHMQMKPKMQEKEAEIAHIYMKPKTHAQTEQKSFEQVIFEF